MIQSLFIINGSNELCLEKHWGASTCQTALDLFRDHILNSTSLRDVPSISETHKDVLIHLLKDNLFYLAICTDEVNPLLVLQFLSCLTEVIASYFGNTSEQTVKDNLVCLYEILDEMLDGGFPVTTELNVLMEIIKPGNFMKLITEAVTGKTSHFNAELPVCQLSNVRWRRASINYTNNEIYFDVIEHVNAIIDKTGTATFKEVYGHIDCLSKLSGNPDLVLLFNNDQVIDGASLHPCVRFLRWQNERILSFVPPDGKFCLFKYCVTSQYLPVLPITVRHHVIFGEQNGSFDLVVNSKVPNSSKVDSLKLSLRMPDCTTNVVAVQSVGRVRFDSTAKLFEWDIGRLDSKHVNPSLKGTISLVPGTLPPVQNPPILVDFSIAQHIPSGLKIARLDMYREKYKLFKGVRYITKSGNFEIRT